MAEHIDSRFDSGNLGGSIANFGRGSLLPFAFFVAIFSERYRNIEVVHGGEEQRPT